MSKYAVAVTPRPGSLSLACSFQIAHNTRSSARDWSHEKRQGLMNEHIRPHPVVTLLDFRWRKAPQFLQVWLKRWGKLEMSKSNTTFYSEVV